MKSADQIFPVARVDSGFSADRAVHHCEQSGWNLDMRNTAVINCCDESGNVADHPAAETNHKRFAVKSRCDHLVADRADYL